MLVLVIDEAAGPVVRRIFDEYRAGLTAEPTDLNRLYESLQLTLRYAHTTEPCTPQ